MADHKRQPVMVTGADRSKPLGIRPLAEFRNGMIIFFVAWPSGHYNGRFYERSEGRPS